ncbi:MAG: radical SAM protein [Candidatus Woesearchaeota archaeon]
MSNMEKKLELAKIIFLQKLIRARKNNRDSNYDHFRDIFCGNYKDITYYELKNLFEKKVEECNKTDVYIHIPFCKSKCTYCPYFSFPPKSNDKKNYLKYLEKCFYLFEPVLKRIDAECVIVGGGTPSIFSDEELERFTNLLQRYIKFKEGYFERTFEFRFEDISRKKLEMLENAGFNRFSFGIQSFNKETLRLVNRSYVAPEEVKKFVDYCKNTFNFVINVDLMIAIGNHTEEDVLNNLELVMQTRVDTIALYTVHNLLHTSKMYKDAGSLEEFYKRVASLYERIDSLAAKYGFSRGLMGMYGIKYGTILYNSPDKFNCRYSNNPKDVLKRACLLSFGWSSFGKIENTLEYYIPKKPHYEPKDIPIKAESFTPRKERVRFLGNSLRNGEINTDDYFKIFETRFEQDFSTELKFLLERKILKKVENSYLWNINKVNKKIYYFGIFYSLEELIKIFKQERAC